MAAGDEADPVAIFVKAVERGEKALAGDAERGVDPLLYQGIDENVAADAAAVTDFNEQARGLRLWQIASRPDKAAA